MKHPLEVAIVALAALSVEDRHLAVRLAATQGDGAPVKKAKRKYTKRAKTADVSTDPPVDQPPVKTKLTPAPAPKPVSALAKKLAGKAKARKVGGSGESE